MSLGGVIIKLFVSFFKENCRFRLYCCGSNILIILITFQALLHTLSSEHEQKRLNLKTKKVFASGFFLWPGFFCSAGYVSFNL